MKDFNEIVRQYNKMIYHIIHSLHIYRNIDHYYSIGLQSLWEAKMKFKEEKASFSTFAYSTIRGRILTELRREKQRGDKFQNIPPQLFESTSDFEYVDLYLQEEIILSYCHTLTENQKRWVVDTFLHDHSLAEIANKYCVSKEAVKSWRRDALIKLRKLSK